MTLRSRLMIGLIATASFPLISFGTDTTSTTTAPLLYSETEIAYIRGMSCDTFTEVAAKTRCLDIKKSALSQATTATGNTLTQPVKSQTGSEDHHPLVSQSGTVTPKPPKAPMGTGAMMGSGADMEHQIQGLGMAIGKLTPTDRDTLIKMIREYLTTKGLTLGTSEVKTNEAERKGWDGSVKGKKTATEIQAERASLLAKAKAKREEMRKEYVGHVTLMK